LTVRFAAGFFGPHVHANTQETRPRLCQCSIVWSIEVAHSSAVALNLTVECEHATKFKSGIEIGEERLKQVARNIETVASLHPVVLILAFLEKLRLATKSPRVVDIRSGRNRGSLQLVKQLKLSPLDGRFGGSHQTARSVLHTRVVSWLVQNDAVQLVALTLPSPRRTARHASRSTVSTRQ
jgi:hypothetical protein